MDKNLNIYFQENSWSQFFKSWKDNWMAINKWIIHQSTRAETSERHWSKNLWAVCWFH